MKQNLKKLLDYRVVECLLALAGMIAAVVILYKDGAAMTICTLVFAAIVGTVIFLYRRRSLYGVLAGVVGACAYYGTMLYLYPETGLLATLLFGTLVPLAGGITIWGGGMIGMLVAELVKFLGKGLYSVARMYAGMA